MPVDALNGDCSSQCMNERWASRPTCRTAFPMTSRADEVSFTRLANCSRKMRAAVFERNRGTCITHRHIYSRSGQLCVSMHKQASCIMHVSLGPFVGQGDQQGSQGPALHQPYASTVCNMEPMGDTWPMRCKNCSGMDRSAADLSGSSTYAFSFLVSSSLGAICIHQRVIHHANYMSFTWSSSVSREDKRIHSMYMPGVPGTSRLPPIVRLGNKSQP